MKSAVKLIVPVVVCALGAGVASAQGYGYGPSAGYGRGPNSGPFVGLSIGGLMYSEDGLNTITPAAAMLTLGAPIAPYLAVEGRAGAGLGSASSDGYHLDVNSVFAGYLKGSLPLAPGISLYGLGGIANVDLSRDFGAGDTHDTSFSFGVGADFTIYGGTTLNIEWTRLGTGDDFGYHYNIDMASVGATWHFF